MIMFLAFFFFKRHVYLILSVHKVYTVSVKVTGKLQNVYIPLNTISRISPNNISTVHIKTTKFHFLPPFLVYMYVFFQSQHQWQDMKLYIIAVVYRM